MTQHVFKELKFYFRNGDAWTVSHKELNDIWISRVTTSYGRINGGPMQEIHPCKSFKAEILPEADHVKSEDINTGSLEMGMFGRATKYQDIEKLDLIFEDDQDRAPMQIYFPFKNKDNSGLDNIYQSSQISQKNGRLYIVIDAEHTIADMYPEI
ncbi:MULTISPECIES: hypothetical protein [Latilactobacillus]|jgi:hypothetical protein|uniref:Uncharacterized protein n=2 Tax=Latilactobacillus curvatus TaxID=28038 RepID=A0A0B2XHQ0_LATCU|nr:hypothetical protein [Latilactobacillus curvatus]MDT3393456.1 hypothetical protein [Bacillota bacterium]ANJ69299.1 hypothetical protein FBA2_04615 [Latilactobacillus curvatus]ANY13910.1 hypothetical protein BCY75_07895 [Latilactobacillus curvatus]AOO75564.1 hypothetical protein LCW_05580 [Latilactobacillus curvatus]ASN60214.1 hypothetical protein CG419_05995 [Latilactobacillus curvatus]